MDVQLLVVDEHPTVRESLRFVFRAAGVQRLMEAASAPDAVRIVESHEVDVVLLDVSPYHDKGLDALRAIKLLDVSLPVLIHSYCDDPRSLWQSFQLGAAGFVIKGVDKNLLVDAVRRVAAGESVWTSRQMERITQAHDVRLEMDGEKEKREKRKETHHVELAAR